MAVLRTTDSNRGASSSLHYLEMITFPGLILLHVLCVILVVETIVLGSQIQSGQVLTWRFVKDGLIVIPTGGIHKIKRFMVKCVLNFHRQILKSLQWLLDETLDKLLCNRKRILSSSLLSQKINQPLSWQCSAGGIAIKSLHYVTMCTKKGINTF